jgi:hypothetical protein
MRADGNIPMFAQESRVRGLASREGLVIEMSRMSSESSRENQRTREVDFHSNSPLPQNPCNFIVFMSCQFFQMPFWTVKY